MACMNDHYGYFATWSEPDQEWVGRVHEFPSLSHQDPDQDKAMAGIRQLVTDVVADMSEADRQAHIRAISDHIGKHSQELFKRLS